jgi:hypothetical protein
VAVSSAFAPPSADLFTTATLVATNEDADYPIENAQDYNPANPFKATTTSTTITVTHSSAARKAVAFINTSDLTGATITVGGVSVTYAARTLDGQCVNFWKLLDLGAATSTSIVITGAPATVQIGRICLVSALTDMPWLYGLEMYRRHPVSAIRTFGESEHIYDKGLSIWGARALVNRESSRSAIEGLWASAKGRNIPWLLIPDQAVNEAHYVRFVTDAQQYRRIIPNATEMPIDVEAVSMGLVL